MTKREAASSPEQLELELLQQDLLRRQWRPRPPAKIGAAVNDLLARRGYAQQQSVSRCDEAWCEAAGAKLAAKTRAGVLRGGVLEVVVGNSTVLQELTFNKRRLIKRLKELAPDHNVRDLRFRVGAID